MAQSMSDSQVLEYVKDGIRQGKEQKQLASELARKGVTKEQAMRVKQLYEQQNNVNTSKSTGTDINESRLREETKKNTSDMLEDHPTTQDLARGDQVFGRNIFNTRNLTFEPSVNLATPANYRLGPGDEVIIDIWGASQNTIRQQISPEGTINIQKIGPVNLSGMTVSAANDYLKNALNKIYNGLNNTTDPTSDIRLTLGNIRTIQINVMGEVVQPGTYALSSFSTVFHALYRAGGVSDIGSLRNVQLVRNGKNIATIDVYEFIMKGNTQDDIRLQEGDVVIVPAYDVLVKISGKVKRPMRFEMKKDENLATLIKYAGGFEADAYTRSLRVVRQNGEEYEVNTVKDMDYSIYKMRNGDVVTAEAILNRFTNKLEIRGAVYRPGIYQLSGKLNTIRELVNEAQGLTGDAFLNRAVLYRQREDLTSEVVQIDIRSIMDGTSPNLALMKNDILYIPSIHDLEDRGNVTVHGVRTRPRRSSPTGTEWISPVGMTSVAGEMPCKSPSGVNRATCFTKPTTSARSVQSSHGFRRMHSSPTFTPGTTARMMVPTTCSTRPRTSTEAVDCTASSRSAPIYSKAIGHPSVCQTISAISKQAFAQSPLRKGRKCGRGPKTSFLKPCRATAHTAL